MSFKYWISTKIWTCVSYVFYILDTITLKKIYCMNGGKLYEGSVMSLMKLNSATSNAWNFCGPTYVWKYKTNTWKLYRCRENEKYQDWEVPLKNKTWQTDEVAQQCEMQVWIQHSQHLATRHETLKQKSASIIGTQYHHLSRLERVWTICFGWILTCPHARS